MVDALVVSGVALLSAVIGWILSHRWQDRNYRLAVTNNRMQWNESVENWAQRVIEVMVQLHSCFDRLDHEDAVNEASDLAIALSILVDQGRLYFPNVMQDKYGKHKQSSKRGYRSAVLDPLVAAVKLAQGAEIKIDQNEIEGRFGSNLRSKVLRLYLNAFLSMTEEVLLVRESHNSLILRMIDAGECSSASRLRNILCPGEYGAIPLGHRYWLNPEKDRVPDEENFFALQEKDNR